MCAISLALANPLTPIPGVDRKKTTVIVVQNTLVQQWTDEVSKFAPGLKVIMHYAASKNYDALSCGQYDVVITSPHMKLNHASTTPFHRLIVDESHLLASSAAGGYGGKLNELSAMQSTYVWLLTGTPLSGTSISTQLAFLGHLRPADSECRRQEEVRTWERHADGTGAYKTTPVIKCPDGPARSTVHGVDILEGTECTKANADKLCKILIRHSKAQRIHGEVALKLPDLTCRTELLDLSADERTLYEMVGCKEGTPRWLQPWGGSATLQSADSGIELRRKACSHEYGPRSQLASVMNAQRNAAWERLNMDQYKAPTKDLSALTLSDVAKAAAEGGQKETGISFTSTPKFSELTKPKKLVADMKAMQAADPNARVIIFTEHDSTQQNLVKLFNEELRSFVVYEFNRQTAPVKRHKIIREFQGSASTGFAAACIATYSAAAVGVTLTAASRVYLFEPCLDPATEAQAAGRIHRLGQTKEIHVVRLAFRNTIEHAIVEKHEGVKSGSIDVSKPEGRQALRDLYKKHGVHAAHQLTGGPWHSYTTRDNPGRTWDDQAQKWIDPKLIILLTYQKCSGCGASVVTGDINADLDKPLVELCVAIDSRMRRGELYGGKDSAVQHREWSKVIAKRVGHSLGLGLL